MITLFTPLQMGEYQLPNRIFMAPLTRGRADKDGIPGSLMAEYYGARASAGLIIAEATAISPQGYGWLNAPGIWNDDQEKGWKLVTDTVHAKGGRIFLQLWHMGRVSHPDFLNGELPVAPSPLAAEGETPTPYGKKSYVIPRALTIDEIQSTISDFVNAAKRAMRAGFDGIEIHGANGYLIDQFIRDGSNKRTDSYGGNLQNRLRFLLEIAQAIIEVVPSEKVGVRLSPRRSNKGMSDSNPIETFTCAAKLLNPLNLAYIHTLEALPGHKLWVEGERITPHIRKIYQGLLLTNGGYDKDSANRALEANEADAIVFGEPFLANPDLVWRLKHDKELNTPDVQTFYTPGPKGYTDYPIMEP